MKRSWTKQKPLILILDDDAMTRRMLASRARAFADLVEAETEAEAEALFETEEIDLAIVDLELGSGSGLSLIGKLRSKAKTATIPIIVLTASEGKGALERALAAGATSYLVKPLNWRAFGRHIQHLSEIAFRAGYMALHDHLTGLANRVQLKEWFDGVTTDAPQHTHVTTFAIDLDRFKPVNDTFGHFVGDQILIEVGRRLRAIAGPGPLVCRVGGDEFTIASLQVAGTGAARELAASLVAALARPFDIAGHKIELAASVGIDQIALSGDVVPSQSLRNADLALGLAKSEGRNTFRFFAESMSTEALLRTTLEQCLRQAIRNGELELHYQPILNVETERIRSVEALLRWNHPTLGYVAPDRFIPIAEESDLISEIGGWVLHEACTFAATLPSDLRVAVNTSPRQIREGQLETQVASALRASALAPDRLELEIVESMLLDATPEQLRALVALQATGVRIALDDFGEGYSSIGYLQKMKFDKIKIDRGFIANATAHPGARSIIEAVSVLARGFGMTSTAEGVETREHLDLLARYGIDEAQGYFIGKPMRGDDLLKVMARRAPRPHHKGRAKVALIA